MNLFMLNYQSLWRIDMADEMSEALQAMEADEPQANLYRAAEEYVSDQAYELMGFGDDEDFNKLAELMKQAVLYGAHWNEQQIMKDFPTWKKSKKLIEGALLDRGTLYIPRYRIDLSELKKLPKED